MKQYFNIQLLTKKITAILLLVILLIAAAASFVSSNHTESKNDKASFKFWQQYRQYDDWFSLKRKIV